MADKGKMPPALLAHFKKKAEGTTAESRQSPEEKKEADKERRKEAVKKARVRLEEKSKESGRDKEKEVSERGPKAS